MDSGVDGSVDCSGAGSMAAAMTSSMDGSVVDCLDSNAARGIEWPWRGWRH